VCLRHGLADPERADCATTGLVTAMNQTWLFGHRLNMAVVARGVRSSSVRASPGAEEERLGGSTDMALRSKAFNNVDSWAVWVLVATVMSWPVGRYLATLWPRFGRKGSAGSGGGLPFAAEVPLICPGRRHTGGSAQA